MTMTVDSLDSFGQLAKAIGLLDSGGQPNASWFGDPVGSTSNQNGLRQLLADDGQRAALWTFQTAFRWIYPSVQGDGQWSDSFGALVRRPRSICWRPSWRRGRWATSSRCSANPARSTC